MAYVATVLRWALAGVLLVILAGVILCVYMRYIEPNLYHLQRERIVIGTPDSGGGSREPVRLKILHITDTHLSYPEWLKIKFLSWITGEEYDLIVLTGDLFQDYLSTEYAGVFVSCPPRLGAVAVLGNHEYLDNSKRTTLGWLLGWKYRRFRDPRGTPRDVQPFVDSLEHAGVRVLRNQSATFPAGRVYVIGSDFPSISQAQLETLVAQAPDGHLIIAAVHVPKHLDMFAGAGVHLVLAGHTHGGQIYIPGRGGLFNDSDLPRQKAAGLTWWGKMAVYVSPGLGAHPKSNYRFGCPPSATVIEVVYFPNGESK